MKLVGLLIEKELRILRTEPRFFAVMFVVPAFMQVVFTSSIAPLLPGVDGTLQTLPASIVLFGFYVVFYAAFSHFRDRAWGTWDVAVAAGASRTMLVCALAVPYLLLGLAQSFVLTVFGVVVMGGNLDGSAVGFALVLVAYQVSSMGFTVFVVGVSRTMSQMQQTCQLLIPVFGAASGGLIPSALMPTWIQVLAHATPQFWAIEGLRGAMSPTGTLSDALVNAGVLTLIAMVTSAIGGVGLRRRSVSASLQ